MRPTTAPLDSQPLTHLPSVTTSPMRSRSLAVCLFACLLTLLISSAPASAQTSDWTFCAWEGAMCTFSGTQEVRYGADGTYLYQTLTDGTACLNSVFGDPLVGTLKSCAVRPTEWTFCAGKADNAPPARRKCATGQTVVFL